MNFQLFNGIPKYLVTLLSVAAIIVITAFSIEMLYRLFEFIDTTARASVQLTEGYLVSYGN